MRREVEAAERRWQVREAARAWHRARAIDDGTRQAIEAAYPDDRSRLGPAFRVLAFGFAVVAVSALFGFVGVVLAATGDRGAPYLLVAFGLFLVAATEVQTGRLRRAQGGTEAATAFLGAGYLAFGLAWLLGRTLDVRGGTWVDLALAVAALTLLAAAGRWGYALFAAAGTAALFLLAGRAPLGRLAWIAGGALLAPVLARAGEAAALAPPHRRGARMAAAVALVFLYLAVHRGSWDWQLVERMADRPVSTPAGGALGVLAAAATALVPLATLAWGVATRRRWLMGLGALGILASLVTLRFYVHVAPLWTVLILGGTAALALAAALRRYLEAGAGRERRGLTADALFTEGDGRGALELAAAAVTLAPEARPAAAPGFEPGGGRYGGGGASGRY